VSGSTDAALKLWDARPLTPALSIERESNSIVQSLFDKRLTRSEATARIRNDATISEPVRACALKLVDLNWERMVRREARSVLQRLFGLLGLRLEVCEAILKRA
jgi:hypothetical protein